MGIISSIRIFVINTDLRDGLSATRVTKIGLNFVGDFAIFDISDPLRANFYETI
jgi:hypothetical protein